MDEVLNPPDFLIGELANSVSGKRSIHLKFHPVRRGDSRGSDMIDRLAKIQLSAVVITVT